MVLYAPRRSITYAFDCGTIFTFATTRIMIMSAMIKSAMIKGDIIFLLFFLNNELYSVNFFNGDKLIFFYLRAVK